MTLVLTVFVYPARFDFDLVEAHKLGRCIFECEAVADGILIREATLAFEYLVNTGHI
jgi:hypothetical protein